MITSDGLFTGSIPLLYNQLMVPMLFEPYAADLATRVQKLEPVDVLETAAGTGAVTRAMAGSVSTIAHITATDLNQPMLDVAAGLSPDDSRLTWLACDATSLPFLNATFDALVCQFGVMFFPDKPKAFSEAARVLRKDGTFLFNVWDRIAANDFVAIATDVLTKRFPDDPPQFMERVPHGVFDTDLLTKQLQTAGFAKVDVDVVEYISKSATPMDAATAYCQGTPLRNEILARDPDGLGRCTQAVATALQSHLGPGPIKGKIRAFVLTASKA